LTIFIGSYISDAEGNLTYFGRNGRSIIGLGNLSAYTLDFNVGDLMSINHLHIHLKHEDTELKSEPCARTRVEKGKA
jgi:hypothetical protein